MTTIFLATAIGWYMVVSSVLVLSRADHIRSVMGRIIGDKGQFFILALLTFLLGLLMVVSHNIWVMGWPVVVTLLSWLVLISGLIRLFFPDTGPKMGLSFINNPMKMTTAAIIFLLIGLYLLAHVYYF